LQSFQYYSLCNKCSFRTNSNFAGTLGIAISALGRIIKQMQQNIFSKNVQEILVEIDNITRTYNEDRILATDLLSLIKEKEPLLSKHIDKYKIHHRKKIEIVVLMEEAFQLSLLEGSLIVDSIHILLSVYRQIDEKIYQEIMKEVQTAPKPVKKDNVNQKFNKNNLFVDLTKKAMLGEFDHLVERNADLNLLITKLLKSDKRSIMIAGESGIGKTSLVRLLAKKIVNGQVPSELIGTKILELDMLMASGYFNSRPVGEFSAFVDTLVRKTDNVVFFIDNLEVLGGGFYFGIAGGKSEKGHEARIIGANSVVKSEYFTPNIATKASWEYIHLNEPTKEELLNIAKSTVESLKQYHKVTVKPKALEEFINLVYKFSDTFEEALPGSMINYLDELMATVKSEKTILKKKPAQMFEHLNLLKQKLSSIKLNLKNQKKDKITGELSIQEVSKVEKEINKIETELKQAVSKTKDTVKVALGKHFIQKSFAEKTGVPIGEVTKDEKKMLSELEQQLKSNVIGQDQAVEALVRALRRSYAGLREINKPIISALFLGPTGVGKTQTAKELANEVFGGWSETLHSSNFLRLDMSDFSEKHTVARLIGAPPGYVGYSEGGQLTSFITENPHSLVLFDEVEKADPQVLNILLQIMEEGKLVDMTGNEVDFSNAVVILTSNIGASQIKQKTIGFDMIDSDELVYKDMQLKLLDELKKQLKPELINRMDEIIVFRQLNTKDMLKICELELKKVEKMLKPTGHKLDIDLKSKELLVKEGYSDEYGARPLKRTITRLITDPLSEQIIKSKEKKVSFKARVGKKGLEFII